MYMQALRNTKLLAAYTKIDSRVPELGCALKHLAKVYSSCLSNHHILSLTMHTIHEVLLGQGIVGEQSELT